MTPITFVTGNQKKADFLAAYLGHPIEHEKIELDELQSLDMHEIISHKVRQAFANAQKPVLVEDVSLEFSALGGLPGPFIKWFVDKMSFEEICSLLAGKDRGAVARCGMGYFDGIEEKYFESSMAGTIAEKPAGTGGYGWDVIFIPEGYMQTRAELNPEDEKKTHLVIKPFAAVKEFLAGKK